MEKRDVLRGSFSDYIFTQSLRKLKPYYSAVRIYDKRTPSFAQNHPKLFPRTSRRTPMIDNARKKRRKRSYLAHLIIRNVNPQSYLHAKKRPPPALKPAPIKRSIPKMLSVAKKTRDAHALKHHDLARQARLHYRHLQPLDRPAKALASQRFVDRARQRLALTRLPLSACASIALTNRLNPSEPSRASLPTTVLTPDPDPKIFCNSLPRFFILSK